MINVIIVSGLYPRFHKEWGGHRSKKVLKIVNRQPQKCHRQIVPWPAEWGLGNVPALRLGSGSEFAMYMIHNPLSLVFHFSRRNSHIELCKSAFFSRSGINEFIVLLSAPFVCVSAGWDYFLLSAPYVCVSAGWDYFLLSAPIVCVSVGWDYFLSNCNRIYISTAD